MRQKAMVLAAAVLLIVTACSTSKDLSITVLDVDGRPVAAASVTVTGVESIPDGTGSSDGEGLTLFSGLPGESVTIGVEVDGFFPETIDLVLEAGVNEVTVEVTPIAFDLSLTVLDAQGQGVEGALVGLSGLDVEGVTDASGTAVWAGLPGESVTREVTVSVEANGFFPESSEVTLTRESTVATIPLMPIAFDLSVAVVDEEGAPVSGATVVLSDFDESSTTDASGTVDWSGLAGDAPTQMVTVSVETEDFFPESVDQILTRDGSDLSVRLTLIPFDLALQMTDAEGVAVEGVTVGLAELGATAQTDESGLASWLNLPGGVATVTHSAQGYLPGDAILELERGPNDVAVAMERDPFGILPSEACPAGTTLLMIEDFQDGQMQGWSVEAGWVIEPDPTEPGNLVLMASSDPEASEPTGAHTAVDDFTVLNVLVRGAWRTDTGYASPAVGRSTFAPFTNDDGNAVDWTGYTATIAGTQLHMYRNDFAPGETEVYHTYFGDRGVQWPTLGEWRPFEWIINGGDLSFWIDGQEALSVTDPNPPEAGRIGFGANLYSLDAMLLLDNVVFCELTGPYDPGANQG